jgi:hypothetical protein
MDPPHRSRAGRSRSFSMPRCSNSCSIACNRRIRNAEAMRRALMLVGRCAGECSARARTALGREPSRIAQTAHALHIHERRALLGCRVARGVLHHRALDPAKTRDRVAGRVAAPAIPLRSSSPRRPVLVVSIGVAGSVQRNGTTGGSSRIEPSANGLRILPRPRRFPPSCSRARARGKSGAWRPPVTTKIPMPLRA